MIIMKNDYITGTVRTNRLGSAVTFDICPREEWEQLNDTERNKLILDVMMDSGVVEVSVNED